MTSGGWNQTQTVRSIGALVEFQFFRDRQTDYEIQGFFIAKDDSTKKRYVFDTALLQSKQKSGKKDFSAAPLKGDATQWLDIPVTGTYSASDGSGGTFRGTLTYSTGTTGSHVEGWIVRFVSSGRVLCVNSNQQFLSDLAHEKSGFFSAVADVARKAQATSAP